MKTTKGTRAPIISMPIDSGNVSLDYPPGRAKDSADDGTPPAPLHGYERDACTHEIGPETQSPKK